MPPPRRVPPCEGTGGAIRALSHAFGGRQLPASDPPRYRAGVLASSRHVGARRDIVSILHPSLDIAGGLWYYRVVGAVRCLFRHPHHRSAVDALARRLPFDLDDVEAAGQAYALWRSAPTPERLEVAQVWAYLYIHRYAAAKLTREHRDDPLALDTLTTDAFARVLAHHGSVRDPAQFPAWVSVVCKNTFRAWLRRGATSTALPDDDHLADPDEPGEAAPEPHLVALAAERAIEALPSFLREIARRRFVEHDDYERIAADLGHGVATVRAYAKRARERLQSNAGLRALYLG